ncbi:class I SAM-dependent methyltransferase [Agreia sp. COWG]|uniref:class I SAM-dependent methyltransferase n=1 Tax=Agreia sp. COWG TaxID=2773266 RepID=UPI0019265069|nr:class I SAM-dependent methyltransferase [Agreia sp. COWG]CAD6008736.1 Ubiquinone/menaquinone biosynthesis C-methylase UbiE [Agreia sp. COWG]
MPDVSDAYSGRASEYIEHLGSVAAMHPSDRDLIATWADGVSGSILDAGCGPGHWTNFVTERRLAQRRLAHPDPAHATSATRGIDLVPEFIEHARRSYPGIPFDVGSIDALNAPAASLGGILAWYSLIHHEPDAIRTPIDEFARSLAPGGLLLLGFFEGPTIERFEHAVVGAYRWPVGDLSERLRASGFEIVETHTRTGEGYRPHAAIIARRTS